MSSQQPPIPYPLNPIFNENDWIYPSDTTYTLAQLTALFLLKAGDIATGLITFSAGLSSNSTTLNTTTNINNTLNINNGIALLTGSITFNGGNTISNSQYTGNSSTATTASNVVVATGGSGVMKIALTQSTGGNYPILTNTPSYDASTGSISSTSFTGSLIGNANTATNSTNATNSTYITVTSTSPNADCPIVVSNTTGTGLKALQMDTDNSLTYNPSTNILKVPNITFTNSTNQLSAYTGWTTASTYPYASITTDINGKITNITSGTAPTNFSYSQLYAGATVLTNITIPTNCIKFDIKVFGTGGLASAGGIGVPDGTHIDYYYRMGGCGGGAGVAYKEGIPMVKNVTYFNNTLSYDNSSGTYTEIKFNGTRICTVYNGNNGTTTTGGLGCTQVPITNVGWGSWTYWNGDNGQNASESYSSPNTGQIGGGCLTGGIIGYPTVNSSSGGLNQAGQGQQYGALSGPSYGFPVWSASPVNRGGCLITWYIQN